MLPESHQNTPSNGLTGGVGLAITPPTPVDPCGPVAPVAPVGPVAPGTPTISQVEPLVYTYKRFAVVLNQSCPTIGCAGAVELAKFSSK